MPVKPVSCVNDSYITICKPVSLSIMLRTCEQQTKVRKYKTFTDRGRNSCWLCDVEPVTATRLCYMTYRVVRLEGSPILAGVRHPQATALLQDQCFCPTCLHFCSLLICETVLHVSTLISVHLQGPQCFKLHIFYTSMVQLYTGQSTKNWIIH
jgi:hypothetical protein